MYAGVAWCGGAEDAPCCWCDCCIIGFITGVVAKSKGYSGRPMGGTFEFAGVALFNGTVVFEWCSRLEVDAGLALAVVPVTRLLKPGGAGVSADWPRWRRLQRVASS